MKFRNFVRNYLFNGRVWAYTLFWTWNIIFLAFVAFGFGPTVLPEVWPAVQAGIIPSYFVLYGIILISIPVLTVVLGLTWLRKKPYHLLALGYGLEGPLMAILAVRFFALGVVNPAVALVLTIATIALITFLWHLLDNSIERYADWRGYLHVIGLSCLIATGLYFGIWVLFYAVPLSNFMWEGLVDILSDLPLFFSQVWGELRYAWRDGIGFLLFITLGAPLYLFTALLFVLMPLAVPIIYTRAWWRGTAGIGRTPGLVITLILLSATFLGFQLTNRQPQAEAFALVKNGAATIEEAEALLRQEQAIRRGLLNSYLGRTRYLSSNGEVFHIRELYRDSFEAPVERAAALQSAYEAVAQPVLYRPVSPPVDYEDRWQQQALNVESVEAAELYETFFDESINDGERDTVVRAARSTWNETQARAAWEAVDDREIHLEEQSITVTPHGDLAEIELYEVYRNQTANRQEVVYYFTLPESAAITGVWLGTGPEKEFAYRVSPRGAAQQLYQEEVQRRVDPALVEQIGTRQYRLRVFPIEPNRLMWDRDTGRDRVEEAPPLHMWLSFTVMADGETGDYPLPRLSDHFNVYWDAQSTRLINGEPFESDLWLPENVAGAEGNSPQAYRLTYPDGSVVTAEPLTNAELPPLPEGLNLAVVLDRSRSMARSAEAVRDALTEIGTLDPDADLYLTASEIRGESPTVTQLNRFDQTDIIYYGGQNSAELLQQFDQLQSGQTYDAVLVLTDNSGFSLADGITEVPIPAAPVWMIHLQNTFPDGYDDHTLEAIQASGGGSAGSLDEALLRIAAGRQGYSDIVDRYRWTVTRPGETPPPVEGVLEAAPTDPFGPLAARRVILAEMIANRAQIDDVALLDQLHAVAQENSIVTPYSSMIVLVNIRQQNRLDELEAQDDRFDREFEEKGETPTFTPPVTGVPEPEEWLLIFLALGFLGWVWINNRRGEPLVQRPLF